MSVELSKHVREEIDRWVAKFPPDRKRSAVISALHAAQHENHGFLTPPIMDAVAEYLGLPNIQVYEIATFYSMFETKPVGRHHVSVCTNISCMLRGSQEVVDYVEKKLGIKTGESTPDGRIYLKRLNRPADALRFYEAAHASPIPHLDWQATIDKGIAEAKKALLPQPTPSTPIS